MRVFSVVAGLAVLLLCAVVHGRWTNRWGPAPELEEAAARLARVPRTVGDWEGVDAELSAGDRQATGGAGYLLRRYTNRRDGRSVLVFLLCGRPGPVSVHTPDVCYESSGYEMIGEPAPRSVKFGAAAPAEFKTVEVRPGALSPGAPLHVYWSWGADGAWRVPRSPRLAFARQRVLFKLYAIVPAEADAGPAKDGPTLAFLRQLLPKVQRRLFPDAESEPAGGS
ncbi:MAG TPA: exosortase-associated EpsI family protein [Gemmataceae bacterium]|nr:exosortase-associated EpsI family protein [Gemmataceae bacterium]